MPEGPRGADAVRRICEGWNEMTVQEWRDVCTPDVKYQNMAWDRIVHEGPDAIHGVLEEFLGGMDVAFDVNQLDGGDSVVFAERTEHFTPGVSGEPFDVPVTGVFELQDGRISAWRDYFDRRALKW